MAKRYVAPCVLFEPRNRKATLCTRPTTKLDVDMVRFADDIPVTVFEGSRERIDIYFTDPTGIRYYREAGLRVLEVTWKAPEPTGIVDTIRDIISGIVLLLRPAQYSNVSCVNWNLETGEATVGVGGELEVLGRVSYIDYVIPLVAGYSWLGSGTQVDSQTLIANPPKGSLFNVSVRGRTLDFWLSTGEGE